jgi:hypothetical protein
MNSVYCTVISQRFVSRALALQESLANVAPDATFFFYCIDDTTAPLLRSLNLAKARVFGPKDFETPALLEIKKNVTQTEYCWVCKSVALLHAMDKLPKVDWAVWVDSDMFAFGNPDCVFKLYPTANVLLTPHRFSTPEFKAFEPNVGRLNAGYAAFKRSAEGRAALMWWRERCFEACSRTLTADAYGDQKYLERMRDLHANVVEVDFAGLNCAPWNVFGATVRSGDNGITVSSLPLLLYHFQGLKMIRSWLFDLYDSLHFKLPADLRRLIYKPYLSALAKQADKIEKASNQRLSGFDGEFAGARGLYVAFKRLTWSKNMNIAL